ncbi:MAG: DUF2268 domain-containing putative Zn-dependent protease [Lacunisphaera sp.]
MANVTTQLIIAQKPMDRNAAILEIAEEVKAIASKLIPAGEVRFRVNSRPKAVVPFVGVGGSCFSKEVVSLDVDSKLDFTDEKKRRLIRYTVAHELHHAARWHSVGCGRSLGEALVFEGLADHFARQIEPSVVMPWTRSMSPVSRSMCRFQVSLILQAPFFSRRVWFYRGSAWRGIPRWAGYSLGYEIVGRYLDSSGQNASDCCSTPAMLVIKKRTPNQLSQAHRP